MVSELKVTSQLFINQQNKANSESADSQEGLHPCCQLLLHFIMPKYQNIEYSVVYSSETANKLDFLQLIQMSQTTPLFNQSVKYITHGNLILNPCNRDYIPGQCSGKWSDEEHMNYIAFIDFHKEIMKSKEKRRSNKFYRQMADFIGTRNALQCRSHHQKLQTKYQQPLKIVSIFKQNYDQAAYKNIKDRILHSKKAKQLDREVKIQANDNSKKNMEIQTQIVEHPFSSNQNNTSIDQCYLSFTSPYQIVNPYPIFSSYYSVFNPSLNIFIKAGDNWSQPVFSYGMEFN